MKKKLILFGICFLSIIITFIFSEEFSLYHFGTIPTFTTTTYLLIIFFITSYLLATLTYIFRKKKAKEKIGPKRVILLLLIFVAILLLLFFIAILNIDWLNHYSNSAPFYIIIISRAIEFLLPSLILIIIIINLLSNKEMKSIQKTKLSNYKFEDFLQRDKLIAKGKKIIKIREKILNEKSNFLKALLIHKYNKLLYECNSSLPTSSQISNKIIYPHGVVGIFISRNATIDDGCVIFQQVTIGSNTLPDSKSSGAPTIGKNCYIGAGAKIIGNIKIGNNVRIGANTTVTKDVKDNCTIVSSPSRIITHNKKLNNKFLNIYEFNEIKNSTEKNDEDK